jgi:hypothetical protein
MLKETTEKVKKQTYVKIANSNNIILHFTAVWLLNFFNMMVNG